MRLKPACQDLVLRAPRGRGRARCAQASGQAGSAIDVASETLWRHRAIVMLKRGPTADRRLRKRHSCRGHARVGESGHGDVLAGIVAALLAQHVDAFDAACLGALLHAGGKCRGKSSNVSVIEDVIAHIPDALKPMG